MWYLSTPKKVIADITIKEWTLSLYVMKSYIDFADNHEGEMDADAVVDRNSIMIMAKNFAYMY